MVIIAPPRREIYEAVRELIKDYYNLENPSKSNILSKLENYSLTGPEILELVEDLDVFREENEKIQMREAIWEAVKIYNEAHETKTHSQSS